MSRQVSHSIAAPVNGRTTRMAQRTSFEIPVATLANGHRLTLHVHELRAEQEGPTLLVVAGIMGDQPTGVETARRAALLLESGSELRRGRVLVLPVEIGRAS